MCWEDQGQFTGEISPLMLKEIGVKLVMIGHSERRHVFGETDAEENKKVKASLAHGFTTLLCIGEAADEIPVLYGGSVNPENSNQLIVQPSIDGLFTERAAWDADKFDTLIRDALKTYYANNN